MTVQDYVNDILCVPVTRIGNRYITAAIEYVIDTKDHKFYNRLSEIFKKTTRYMEKAMRDARNIGLKQVDPDVKTAIMGDKVSVSTTEYVIKAAQFYRRTYEDKEQG